ncbi:thermonuclease family protein [Nereida sp. MMG025]|uniref:thermonuclease family protein n=1 Tax=Nereida sp. MMG025 TaxID=2909981 RepID=UPI001F1CC6BE|nr:thermonuclease family protein [Nereida sp. MMG025]MCF6445903.1 thermonuclease family protein [Nereida sp. MMG025]
MEILAVCFGFALFVWAVAKIGAAYHDKNGTSQSRNGNVGAETKRPTKPKTITSKQRQNTERQRPITSGVEHDPPPPVPPSMKLRGRAWVIDGDTIVVSKIKVRLAGIDAPELDQPWGQKSKWAMVKLCKGNVIDVALTGETSYDRLVGTCYLSDGTDVGAELIKQGLALDGGHFSKGKYRHLEPDGIRRKLKYYGRWR